MNTSWKNTRKSLKNFANLLVCNKCGKEPINAMRYTNCGHFFCIQCIRNDSTCMKCDTPVQPIEIHNDHMIKSLTSYCNVIAELVEEKDLWNKTTNFQSTTQIPLITLNSESNINKRQQSIPIKNINKCNTKGETLLHIACLKNNEDRVKALLASGANPNTKDNAGWTPLVGYLLDSRVQLLKKFDSLNQEVVNYGFTKICQLLLECGGSPNIPGAENKTPLHDAAINNRLAEAKLLLQYSAKKDVFDRHGKKPIDYCEPSTEMWNLLSKKRQFNDETDAILNCTLNSTLNQSLFNTQSSTKFVVYALNLREENNKCLDLVALKHKIEVTSVFRRSITHVIVEANNKNIVKLSYEVMIALVRGNWLLNSEWIQLAMDVDDILAVDLEPFEINGSPIIGIPRKARENAQNQNPGLFDQCYFYFALQPNKFYNVSGMLLKKDNLITLVREGNGSVLSRVPRPDDTRNKEKITPFHTANNPSHSLYKCTHYIIYVPGRDEPRLKYNMSHIKSLPLIWLIECIETFTLIDPSHLGLY